jgi:hypothetical protein
VTLQKGRTRVVASQLRPGGRFGRGALQIDLRFDRDRSGSATSLLSRAEIKYVSAMLFSLTIATCQAVVTLNEWRLMTDPCEDGGAV